MGWAQLGEGVPQVSERPGSWGTTQAPLGTETFLLPGILSAYLRPHPRPPPARPPWGPSGSSPWLGLGASTSPITRRPWGPASRLFTRPASPQSQPCPRGGGGTTDGGGAILTRVCSRWGRKGSSPGLEGAGTFCCCCLWGASILPLRRGNSPELRSEGHRSNNLVTGAA